MPIIPRHVVRFRDLRIGDHFKFANLVADRYSSGWHRTAKKVSSRCYVFAESKKPIHVKFRGGGGGWRMRAGLLNTCVGSVNVPVEFTGRRSPVKRRRGRGRGKAMLAGYRRRSR